MAAVQARRALAPRPGRRSRRLAVLRRSTAAVHDYLAALYLCHLPPATGPLCAIDLDGVLECDQLGFSATSPTGALALRA